ncbi:hypothetical protein D3C84_1218320 [compost metagenome]
MPLSAILLASSITRYSNFAPVYAPLTLLPVLIAPNGGLEIAQSKWPMSPRLNTSPTIHSASGITR